MSWYQKLGLFFSSEPQQDSMTTLISVQPLRNLHDNVLLVSQVFDSQVLLVVLSIAYLITTFQLNACFRVSVPSCFYVLEHCNDNCAAPYMQIPRS